MSSPETGRRERHEPIAIIVGAPRSGTTLLRFMLDANPGLAIPPETGFLALTEDRSRMATVTRDEFLQAITRFPPACPNWEDFEIPEELFRAALAEIEPFSAAEGFRAFYRLYARRMGKPRWGDKTPLHSFYLEPIERLLPEAHFIHIVRDGRDVCLSWRQQWFRPSEDMRELSFQWMSHVLAARRQGARCSAYLEIRYEDLVQNTECSLRSICDFLALDFGPGMLQYHERVPERLREHHARRWVDGSRTVTQDERWRQQRLTSFPPDETRVSAWRTTMSFEERREFREVAGATLVSLGYPLE